ncbi:MAG: hypothetical protein JSW44_02835 [Candidatus Bathyarchaeota archaeon]|nr:MAG: hypothetical protein JSW44_02835 [Candidatus Bathyarchaeota archaeon]
MLIQTKLSKTLLSLLIIVVIATSIFDNARGARDGFVVQNVEISPKVARNGENVRVKANLRNLENKTKKCCITAFVGESVVEELKEITFSPQETIPLVFTVNTTSLPQGNNAIDVVVEQPTSKQEIFDLGNIVVAQETVKPENIAGFNMLYLLPVLPVGAVVSFFVWKRRRNKGKEEKAQENLLPNLLNEVLNFEEKAETEAEKNKNSSDAKNYIR